MQIKRKKQPKKRLKLRLAKCLFCEERNLPDWKSPEVLRAFMSERGRISSRSRSGVCAKHQRKLTVAIKRARHLALLPFVVGVR